MLRLQDVQILKHFYKLWKQIGLQDFFDLAKNWDPLTALGKIETEMHTTFKTQDCDTHEIQGKFLRDPCVLVSKETAGLNQASCYK